MAVGEQGIVPDGTDVHLRHLRKWQSQPPLGADRSLEVRQSATFTFSYRRDVHAPPCPLSDPLVKDSSSVPSAWTYRTGSPGREQGRSGFLLKPMPSTPECWTVRHFSQANPAGPGRASVPALLRTLANAIEALGPVEIQDVVIESEMTEHGFRRSRAEPDDQFRSGDGPDPR